MYRVKADQSRLSELPVAIVKANNLYASKWLGPVFVGLYICGASPLVLNKDLKLGFFLATVSILNDMSSLFLDVYKAYQKISEISEPLVTLTIYFNMPTDLRDFKKSTEHELNWVHGARLEVMKRPPPPPDAKMLRTDLIPILLEDMFFDYPDIDQGDRQPILEKTQLRINQGSLVAITGEHGCGKATLLKLLSRHMNPIKGNVFIAPHLRILFVSQEPTILLDMTLWENLTLGCPDGIDPALVNSILAEMKMDRVLAALEHFQALQTGGKKDQGESGEFSSRDLLLGGDGGKSARKGESKGGGEGLDPAKMRKELEAWFEKLNYTDKVKIHLARAFIMNPEVMIMHRPLYHFSDSVAEKVLQLMKQHHKNRGMCMPLTTLGRRRPRTLFYTTDADWQDNEADLIWKFDNYKLTEHRPKLQAKFESLNTAKKAMETQNGSPRNGDREITNGSLKSARSGDSWRNNVSEWCFAPSPRQNLPNEK
jgi:ABC-type multidrug transport system fused ATPase/permease subunit